jgi:hypothetical protein
VRCIRARAGEGGRGLCSGMGGGAPQREHLIVRELVVRHPVHRQVGVLHRADPHRARHAIDKLGVGGVGLAPLRLQPRAHVRLRARQRLVQEVDELHRLAAPRLELLAVLAQHEAERHVLERDAVGREARLSRDGEHLSGDVTV